MSFVAKIEADVSSFSANMNKASQDTGKFVSEINKASNAAKVVVPPAVIPSINNFSKSVGNANGVTMEFTRIIQDAPFGMIGIGNNLQQLSANWQTYSESSKRAAAQTGATVTTMTLLKGALSSMISPAALLSLGVAAVTSAWTFYTMWSQKAAKATKETKSEIEKLIESLNDVSTTMFEASKSSAKESAELRILYGIATDVTASTSERRDAAKRLIDQYPELFKKIGTEKIMLGEAKTAYDSLSTSILATARAQAAYGKIGEKAAQQIAIDEANKALQKEIDLLNKAIDTDKKRADQLLKSVKIGQTADESRDLAASADGLRASTVAQQKINDLQKEQSKNLLLRAGLQEGILDLEKVAIVNQKEISEGFGISGEKVKKLKDNTDDLTKALDVFIQKGRDQNDVVTINENINLKYKEIYDTISKIKNVDPFQVALVGGLKLQEQLNAMSESFNKFGGRDIDAGIDIALPEINTDSFNSKSNEKFISNIAKLAKQAGETFNVNLSETIANGLGDAIANISQSIGESLANGGNVIQAMGGALLSSLGSILVSLGEMAIKAGAGILAVQIGLKTLNPFVALAAGAALVAIGSAFSSGAKNLAGAGSGGGYSQSASGSQYNSIGDRNTGKLFNNDKQVVELRLKNGELTGAINLANKRNDRLV